MVFCDLRNWKNVLDFLLFSRHSMIRRHRIPQNVKNSPRLFSFFAFFCFTGRHSGIIEILMLFDAFSSSFPENRENASGTMQKSLAFRCFLDVFSQNLQNQETLKFLMLFAIRLHGDGQKSIETTRFIRFS